MEDEAEIRRQILQLEFQHKKDIAEMRDLNRIFFAEINKIIDRVVRRQDNTQRQLDHLTKLTGITFEDLEFHNQKMQDAGEILSRQNSVNLLSKYRRIFRENPFALLIIQ